MVSCWLSDNGGKQIAMATFHTIEVDLKSAEQIFNSLDPSPFHERDIDEKAERYIVGWAREARPFEPLQLLVTLPEAAHRSQAAQRIPDAIHNYFSYRALQSRQDLRELLRVGQISLVIGMVILVICFGAIRYLSLMPDQTGVIRLIEESLLILGWVANWRPLEIFLYDWWPIRRQIVLLNRLSEMKVELRTRQEGCEPDHAPVR
jgi:hypothetical protein